jgi:DNA-binding MarR family transcriptional regulator
LKLEEEIRQQKFESPMQKAVLNIIFTSNWINGSFREFFKSSGITQQQYNVLRILRGRFPDSANPSDIKLVMLDKNPDLTRLCDRLCAAGFVKRTIDKENRRKMNIVISEKGLELLASLDTRMNQEQAKFTNISPTDAEMLSDLLDKFRG